MEKKTIGSFLAALRRASGMTQQDLADKLNVSNKTVSRWERDEGEPELALIPVLAEIFGVTCDELLRGERRPPEQQTEPALSPKGEKQQRHLVKTALSHCRSLTWAAMAVSGAGLLTAQVCNLAFQQGKLGFLLGCAFYLAATVCQAIAVNQAAHQVEDGELPEDSLQVFRRSIVKLTARFAAVTMGLLGFTLPLLFLDAYTGLSTTATLVFGLLFAGIALAVWAVDWYIAQGILVKRGYFQLKEAETAAFYAKRRRQKIWALSLAGVLAVTVFTQSAVDSIFSAHAIMKGTVCPDYASFVALMETPVEWDGGSGVTVLPSGDEDIPLTELTDEQGNVVCTFRWRNQSVTRFEEGPLPITVYTQSDYQRAQQIVQLRSILFAALYVLEILAAGLIYWKKVR